MKENTVQQDYAKPLNLTEVYKSTLESDVLHVSELLKDNGIPSEIKNTGIGSYLQIYSGVNYLGTSIYVNQEDAESAKTLIDNLWGEIDFEEQEDVDARIAFEVDDASNMDDYRQRYNKSLNLKRNLLKIFIVLMFGAGIVIQLLVLLN